MNLYASWLDHDDYEQEIQLALLTGRNVQRHLIDVTRRATHHRTVRKIEFVSYDPDRDDGEENDLLAAVIEREQVRETFSHLRERQPWHYRCLVLQLAGFSREEIAEREGLTWKQVENSLSGTRRHLRNTA